MQPPLEARLFRDQRYNPGLSGFQYLPRYAFSTAVGLSRALLHLLVFDGFDAKLTSVCGQQHDGHALYIMALLKHIDYFEENFFLLCFAGEGAGNLCQRFEFVDVAGITELGIIILTIWHLLYIALRVRNTIML